MTNNFIISLKIFVLLCTVTYMVYLMIKKTAKVQSLYVLLLALFSMLLLTRMGNMQYIYPVKQEQNNRKETKKVFFHWHEHWHYYTGSKYFKELGYYGLYHAYVLADYETRDSTIRGVTAANIRNLKNTYTYIPIQQVLSEAYFQYKPKFTPERWEEFKLDYIFFRNTAANRWLDSGLWDVGFNVPPTWSVIGYPITNMLSISKKWEGDKPYSKALKFPFLDVAILLLIGYFLYRGYGVVGLATFFIIFGTSYISEMRWNNGALLRFMWLLGLAGGLTMLKEKKYLYAGIFLGFSACCRVFPIMFLGAAGLSLLIAALQDKNWEPFKKLVIGSASIGGVLFLLGLIMFGWHAYAEFFEMIFKHKNIGFIQSIGYRRIAVFDDYQRTPMSFMWEQGLTNFRNWNYNMDSVWEAVKLKHYVIMLITLIGVLVSMIKMKTHEAVLLLGTLLLFYTQILTCYYYVFLAFIPVVLFNRDEENNTGNIILVSAFFLLWIYTMFVNQLIRNGIVENYYVSLTIYLFLLAWIVVRLIPVVRNVLIPQYKQFKLKKASR